MLAEYLPQLLLAWGIQWMGVMSPGPSVMLILSVATTRGRTPALLTCLGIAAAAAILALGTVLGLTTLLTQVAGIMFAVKLIGAAYLLWLAYGSFKKAVHPPVLNIAASAPLSPLKTIGKGMAMQLSNPKALFFWLAIAAVGGVGDAPLPIVGLFIAGAFVNSFLGHGAYGVVLSSAAARDVYTRARRWIEGGLGALFCIASFKLATARI